jgi:hypothetical protein
VRGEALLATVLASALLAAPAVAVAAAPRAAVGLHSGGLSADAPPDAELPVARVSGEAVAVEAPVGPFRVSDTRAGAAGWTLVVTASPPSDALGRPLGAGFEVVPRAASTGGAGTTPGAPGPIAAPRAVLTAPPGAGAGLTEVTPLFRILVPPSAATGVYATTLVVTIS